MITKTNIKTLKRIVFSVYIDIEDNELDWQPPYNGEKEPKTNKAKREFANNYQWLLDNHCKYTESISVDYLLFTNDNQWKSFKTEYQKNYPFLTTYNIINFYKIYLMYYLKDVYDEILFIDFDVIPVTTENFFTEWDLNKGVAVLNNDSKLTPKPNADHPRTARSPIAKYWNSYAMLRSCGCLSIPNIYNTGIVGINRQHLNQLDYFNNFDDTLQLMSSLKNDRLSIYPDWIQNLFGWDNETVWAFKMITNNVSKQWLGNKWHFIFDNNVELNRDAKFIHALNKNFTAVKNWTSS